MASQKSKSPKLKNFYLDLAFQNAKINLGKTKLNPSVGCVVVKDEAVISSGYTSIGGRPHAEYNALRLKKNFNNSDLYLTMEPCTHYGITPPCTNLIKKKGIKKVYYSFIDIDKRTANKSKRVLNKKNILVQKIPTKNFKDFYQSYYAIKKDMIPLIDAKIAVSKDYYTIKRGSKWITNHLSRKRVHLIRSEYDCILSTSKSINKDNSLLNCRLSGFDNNKPDLIIIDLNLKIKKTLRLFKLSKKRRVFIITSSTQRRKILYFKKRGVKIVFIKSLKTKSNFISLLMILKKYGYNRLLIESGLIFLNTLVKNRLVSNLYLFQTAKKLGKIGINNSTNKFIKKMNLKNKIKVNLNGENLYKIKIK